MSATPASTFPVDTVPVIGLAHGSRHTRGGEAIERLMAAVGEQLEVPARVAYLDLAQPDLSTVAAELAAGGHTRAVVVPLLFTVAFHATVDVPEAVQEATETSGVEMITADIIGTGDDVVAVLQAGLVEAGAGADDSVLVFAVGSSNPAANAAVQDLALRLGTLRRVSARAAFGTGVPKVDDVLSSIAEPLAVAPLFLAAGLLLDPMYARAAESGWVMAAPLGEHAAAIVADRYRLAQGSVELG